MRAFAAAAFAALALWAGSPAAAQDVLPVPVLSARVMDLTGTLNPGQRSALEAKLATFESESGPQIVVLLVATTQPEDIAAYAQRVADSWKIGRREVGDGVLVVVAKGDRRVRIEVAKALEGAIPDLAARQIIDEAMRPAFRAEDYAGGLNRAVDGLMARVRGEALPAPAARAARPPQAGVQLEDLLMFIFVGVPVVGGVLGRLFGRRFGSVLTSGVAGGLGWWFTHSVLLGLAAGVVTLVVVGLFGLGSGLARSSRSRGGPIVFGGGSGGSWGSGGWSGGGGSGGGFGGGGFSSGGGGDFGGGGASGSW
ncbi:MAG: TPM domain-containing protein [Rubrivivax sp.]